MPNPFIALGTGRCGTNSLCAILRSCGLRVDHEVSDLGWYHGEPGNIHALAYKLNSGHVNGESALYLLPYVGVLSDLVAGLRVIVLHRDKMEVVRSFLHFGSFCLRPQDKEAWIKRHGGLERASKRASLAIRFPYIDAADPQQAFEFWWEMYERLAAQIPEPVLHVNTTDLNDDAALHEICEFIGIPSGQRRFPERRQYYTTKDVATLRELMNEGRFEEMEKYRNECRGEVGVEVQSSQARG